MMRVVAYDIITMGTQINKLHCAVVCSRVQLSADDTYGIIIMVKVKKSKIDMVM